MLTKTLAKNIKSLKSSLEFLNQSSYRLKFNAFSHFLKNNFSTETETASKQINIYKIIKTGENSIYDLPYGYETSSDYSSQSERDRDRATSQIKESFFTQSELMQNVSSILKELEIGRASSSKQSKFYEVRKTISILNQEEIRKEFFRILTSTEILDKDSTELKDNSAEILKIVQTKNETNKNKYDEKDIKSVIKNFLEIGRYFMKNEFYSLEHNVNVPSRISKDTLIKLSDSKKILEILNFSELTNEQMITILPVFILLNNLYIVSENVIEDLISDLASKLFNPLIKENVESSANFESTELLQRYFVFLLINNNLTKSTINLEYLVQYKDIVMKYLKGGLNDILYILTENIFKFVNAKHDPATIGKKEKSVPKGVISIESFLRCYVSNIFLFLGKGDSTESFNFVLFEHFLYSLLLLRDSTYGENIFSFTLLEQIRLFINSGIFNLNIIKEIKSQNFLNPYDKKMITKKFPQTSQSSYEVQKLIEFCHRSNYLELLLEVENKLFNELDQKSEGQIVLSESIFTVINSKKFLHESNSDFKRCKDILINSYINYSPSKKSFVNSLSSKIITDSYGVTLSVDEIDYLLNSLCKYQVKEAKLFFEFTKDFLISKYKTFTPENFVSILYCVSKYNLIDVYELDPLYVGFLFSYEEKSYRREIKQNLPKILFILANFALRTKDFNPLFKEMLSNLPRYLRDSLAISGLNSQSENLEEILLSLSVVELCMKYNLTEIDFGKYFTPELLTSILNLNLLKMGADEKLEKFVEIFGSEKITSDNTNLLIYHNLKFKEDSIPVILVDNTDFNLEGKFVGSVFIKYHHLKSYLKTPPMIINIDNLKTSEDLEKEVLAYWKNPNRVIKKHLH